MMFSYDEEVGCLGVSSMIEAARTRLPRPATVVVGEPTLMRLATQHKGVCVARTQVKGIEAHSSLTHRGESAVMIAGELIAHLGSVARRVAAGAPASGQAFEPPHTTVSVNRIAGGTATNILAALCEFTWDIRSIPGEGSGAILAELASYAGQRLAELAREGKSCAIETTVLADAPPLEAEPAGLAAELVRAVIGAAGQDTTVPFGTEGGYFQRAGWSTVVCGPGSIEQAHRPDEYIERSELAACEVFLDRLVQRQLMVP